MNIILQLHTVWPVFVLFETYTGYPRHRETGKMAKKNIPVRENTGNSENLPKYRENTGISFPQVVNSLILKVKDIATFSIFFQKLNRSANMVLCI